MIASAQEAYEFVLLQIQKEGASTLDPVDFAHDWNNAQQVFVDAAYREMDGGQEVNDDLRPLLPAPLLIPNTGSNTNGGEIFSLPFVQNPVPGVSHGYMHALSVCQRIASSVTDGVPTYAPCPHPGGCSPSRLVGRDQRKEAERDAFWKSTVDEPMHYFVGQQIRTVAPSPYFTFSITIEYLRYPVRVVYLGPGNPGNVNPELPPDTNRKIADIAVRKRLEIIESRRFQTQAVDSQLSKRI
jgi:hypothetical protein